MQMIVPRIGAAHFSSIIPVAFRLTVLLRRHKDVFPDTVVVNIVNENKYRTKPVVKKNNI